MNVRLLSLLLMLSAHTAIAQPDTASEPETEDENWLLDEDADTNQQGWPRFALSLGYMSMDGDGRYRVDKAKGRTITVTITDAEKIPGTLTFTIVDDDHVRMSDLGQAWELALARK